MWNLDLAGYCVCNHSNMQQEHEGISHHTLETMSHKQNFDLQIGCVNLLQIYYFFILLKQKLIKLKILLHLTLQKCSVIT